MYDIEHPERYVSGDIDLGTILFTSAFFGFGMLLIAWTPLCQAVEWASQLVVRVQREWRLAKSRAAIAQARLEQTDARAAAAA